ncbi:hypothetical protein P43SY_011887 [Pythium insidiosum]|uniref:Polyprotein n=1 Tax=Pythium insidiosum TaxID=114742 RepID=A0AAD5M1I2_PYTIN|nr:hypothetical protein P43SY_011887 [Pythium insidiosum]
MIGAPLYVANATRPDISMAVSALSRYLEEPRELHWRAAVRVIRYLKGTASMGIKYKQSKSGGINMVTYCDANWGGDKETHRSTSGVIIMLGGGPVVYRSKRQATISLSSAEAEYMATQEVVWLRHLLVEMGVKIDKPSVINLDSKSAMSIATNHGYTPRAKHIDLRAHFVRDHVADATIALEYVPSELQIADGLTKPVPTPRFVNLRRLCGVEADGNLSLRVVLADDEGEEDDRFAADDGDEPMPDVTHLTTDGRTRTSSEERMTDAETPGRHVDLTTAEIDGEAEFAECAGRLGADVELVDDADSTTETRQERIRHAHHQYFIDLASSPSTINSHVAHVGHEGHVRVQQGRVSHWHVISGGVASPMASAALSLSRRPSIEATVEELADQLQQTSLGSRSPGRQGLSIRVPNPFDPEDDGAGSDTAMPTASPVAGGRLGVAPANVSAKENGLPEHLANKMEQLLRLHADGFRVDFAFDPPVKVKPMKESPLDKEVDGCTRELVTKAFDATASAWRVVFEELEIGR